MSELDEEIKRGESDTLEFKRELPVRERQFLKTVVAFANGKGGRILFGVDNRTGHSFTTFRSLPLRSSASRRLAKFLNRKS